MVATVALAGTAGAAAGWDDDRDGEAVECAGFVSSGPNDDPMQGHLIGTEEVTVTYSGGARVGVDGRIIEGSVGGSYEKTVEYQIGYYRIDGKTYVIDCRDYSVVEVKAK
jgi:hypothetical protein